MASQFKIGDKVICRVKPSDTSGFPGWNQEMDSQIGIIGEVVGIEVVGIDVGIDKVTNLIWVKFGDLTIYNWLTNWLELVEPTSGTATKIIKEPSLNKWQIGGWNKGAVVRRTVSGHWLTDGVCYTLQEDVDERGNVLVKNDSGYYNAKYFELISPVFKAFDMNGEELKVGDVVSKVVQYEWEHVISKISGYNTVLIDGWTYHSTGLTKIIRGFCETEILLKQDFKNKTKTKKGVQKVMSNIVKFAKDLVLSKEDRLLRKHGLVTECGEYTADARELIMHKMCEDNKQYLIDVATKQDEEDVKSNKK